MGEADRASLHRQYEQCASRLDTHAKVLEGMSTHLTKQQANIDRLVRNTERLRDEAQLANGRQEALSRDLARLYALRWYERFWWVLTGRCRV